MMIQIYTKAVFMVDLKLKDCILWFADEMAIHEDFDYIFKVISQ